MRAHRHAGLKRCPPSRRYDGATHRRCRVRAQWHPHREVSYFLVVPRHSSTQPGATTANRISLTPIGPTKPAAHCREESPRRPQARLEARPPLQRDKPTGECVKWVAVQLIQSAAAHNHELQIRCLWQRRLDAQQSVTWRRI